MDSNRRKDDIIPYLEDLKISAFTKADLIKNQIQNVTIGPNATFLEKDISTVQDAPLAVINQGEVKLSGQAERFSPKVNPKITVNNETGPLIPFRQVLKEYEILRQRKVQEAVQSHSKKFELFSAQQNMIRQQGLIIQQQKNAEKMKLYEEEVKLALKKYDEEKINEQKKMNLNYQKLEEERKKIAAALEAKKKETQLLHQCLDKQSKFNSTYQEIMMKIKNCQDDELKAELSENWKHCKELNDLMTPLMEKCKASVSEQEHDMIGIVLKRMIELQMKINQTIKSHEEKKEQIKLETQKNNLSSVSTAETVKDIHNKTVTNEDENSSGSSLNEYISKSRLEVYSKVLEYYQKYVDSFKDLLHLEGLKQFRFDCKKAVNLSVNTISAANSAHLHDKYNKLSNLLSGKNVTIGDLMITASKHPKGIQYCTDLLAKKFVLQGDLMVSGNPESAFAFATIIISIWNESPDFGKLLLANFFKTCPYLIPFYPPRVIDETDQDYYEKQGYRYVEGKVEEQDKFLKRMTGTMRLYFAIMLCFPKKSQKKHPYSIRHAWIWLVSVLRLKPRLDITATMFHTFFETIGFEMQNVYQKQFTKLMKYFINSYLPLMKKIDSGGPVTRLECLIQEFKENGYKFNVPKGLLSEIFW